MLKTESRLLSFVMILQRKQLRYLLSAIIAISVANYLWGSFIIERSSQFVKIFQTVKFKYIYSSENINYEPALNISENTESSNLDVTKPEFTVTWFFTKGYEETSARLEQSLQRYNVPYNFIK